MLPAECSSQSAEHVNRDFVGGVRPIAKPECIEPSLLSTPLDPFADPSVDLVALDWRTACGAAATVQPQPEPLLPQPHKQPLRPQCQLQEQFSNGNCSVNLSALQQCATTPGVVPSRPQFTPAIVRYQPPPVPTPVAPFFPSHVPVAHQFDPAADAIQQMHQKLQMIEANYASAQAQAHCTQQLGLHSLNDYIQRQMGNQILGKHSRDEISLKKQERMKRNRESANASRLRKKDHLAKLEQQMKELTEQNGELAETCVALAADNDGMRNQLVTQGWDSKDIPLDAITPSERDLYNKISKERKDSTEVKEENRDSSDAFPNRLFCPLHRIACLFPLVCSRVSISAAGTTLPVPLRGEVFFLQRPMHIRDQVFSLIRFYHMHFSACPNNQACMLRAVL